MKLFTALPARRDGTLNVATDDGKTYQFTGQPLSCEVEDEDHADELQAKGFQPQDEFEAEQDFLKKAEARAARLAARGGAPSARGTFTPGVGSGDQDADDEIVTGGDGAPQEAATPATGRVRRQHRA